MRYSLLFMLVAASSTATAATYTVAPDGSGDYSTIQVALDAAESGDVIELTDGTFSGNGNRDIDFGGKAITLRSASGNAAICIVDAGGSHAAPHRGFLFQSQEDAGTVLQNLTITGGYAHCDTITCPDAPHHGGGIMCIAASPTIVGCVFSANTAVYEGGGIYASSGAAPNLSACAFEDNVAVVGAGICMWEAAISLAGCTFSGNLAEEGGGGLWSDETDGLDLEDCVFTGNQAAYGGALVARGGTATLSGCTFSGNAAYSWPGSPDGGGAIYGYAATFELTGCVFAGNTAAAEGGGLRLNMGYATLEDCLLYGNAATGGGALYAEYGFQTLRGCTLYGNSATTGGGLYDGAHALLTLERTLIAAGLGGSAVFCDPDCRTPVLTCCNLFGNIGGDWDEAALAPLLGTDGNISLDPEFCSPVPDEHDNWGLQSDSPCAPEQSACGLVGAADVACEDTPARSESWGSIKALFR